MEILERVKQNKIIAIVRGLAPRHMLRLAGALLEGGITMIEVTFNQKAPETFTDTAEAIKAIGREFSNDVLPGAGTVITQEQLQLAFDAGANYIVTPAVDEKIIRKAKELGLGMFPGGLTPTEILSAYNAGADAVKVFPAGSLGADYIKAVCAPLSHIPLLAVGGVDEKNCAKFLRAGCLGIGVGGSLVNKEWIAAGEWDKITALAKEYGKAVREA